MVNMSLLNDNEPRRSAHILYHSIFDIKDEIKSGELSTNLDVVLNNLKLKAYCVNMDELFPNKAGAREKISACLLKEEGVWVIYLNKQQKREQQRFLIAHEIGRYILSAGKEVVENIIYFNNDEIHNEEIMANRFASSLLMPKEKINAVLKVGLSLEKTATLFGVSENILISRLKQLKVI